MKYMMNKKVSLRLWVAVVAGCVAVMALVEGIERVDRMVRRHRVYDVPSVYDPVLSWNYSFHNNGLNSGRSYIYDSQTKERIITGIDWIAVPVDGDSLIIVAKGGKRGFVNRFTGRVAIPWIYDAAWSFTDGVAGVCEGDSVYFIDHSGTPVNGRKFARTRGYDRYVYHGEYAAIPEDGKYGLVDRSGEWVVEPVYDALNIGPRNMWEADRDGRWGVIGADGEVVVAMEYKHVVIHPENGIIVVNDDNSRCRFGYDGVMTDRFVISDVENLFYAAEDADEECGSRLMMDAEMKSYSTGDYYGLMTHDGVVVTPPLYSEIEAVARGIYRCEIPGMGASVLVNGKGERINK